MRAKKTFPQNVLLGELPKDKKLRGDERFGWGGEQYFVAGNYGYRQKIAHIPANHIRGYHPSIGEFPTIDGFGVWIDKGIVRSGEVSAVYVGKASTIFELQDLLGVPRVREVV